MSPDAHCFCKEICVTIDGQSSYVQGSKHVNPAVYYAAVRLQELNNMLATSTALNEEFVQRLGKFTGELNTIDDGKYWPNLDREQVMTEFGKLIHFCRELLK